MRYYATASGALVKQAMSDGLLGCILTPRNSTHPTADLIADNGCFGKTYVGDDAWLAWVGRLDASRVVFATAPDVVADWDATLERSRPFLPRLRAMHVPAALVAQDGATPDTVPWDDIDALFIGGSTAWKMGDDALACVGAAKDRGKHVHMGRVNTLSRLRYAAAIGCDSVDGTYLAFGPDVNLPRLLGFLRAAEHPILEGTAP